ncbi:hypothetical protein D9M72_601550 [compost metagenome]
MQEQALALTVVVGVQTADRVQDHFSAAQPWYLDTRRLQVRRGHVQAPGALLHRHQFRAAHLIDHHLQVQLRIANRLQAGRWRWQLGAKQRATAQHQQRTGRQHPRAGHGR